MIYKPDGTAVELIGGPYFRFVGSLLYRVEEFAVRPIAPDVNGRRVWGYCYTHLLKADGGDSELEAAKADLWEREGRRTIKT